MERSHPSSGRCATPADFDRNRWPTSIGMPSRHHGIRIPAKAGVTGLFPSNRIRLYRLHACPPMPAPPEGPVRPALFEAVVIQVMAPVGYPYAAEAQRVIGERIGMPGQRSSDRRGELQGPIERVEQPLGG